MVSFALRRLNNGLGMVQASKLKGCVLAALLASAPTSRASAATQLNVSQIATGTYSSINWAMELGGANVGGWSLGYFSLATADIDTDASAYFAPDPWSAALTTGPGYPSLTRSKATQNYSQGGAQFQYDQSSSRLAEVDMASSTGKTVTADVFDGGASGASADGVLSYRAQVSNTTAQTLDFFMDLKVPTMKRSAEPGYDLCCAGDSNGGTYSYHRPKSWNAQAAVDVLVDGLPVWSSEQTALYPDTGNSGDPFDELDIAWDQPNGPSTTTLFLGRIAAGKTISVTFIVRADANDLAPDCGIQSPGSHLDHTYEVHCFSLSQQVNLVSAISGMVRGPHTPFRIYAKAPFVLQKVPFHPQVVQPGVQKLGPALPKGPGH